MHEEVHKEAEKTQKKTYEKPRVSSSEAFSIEAACTTIIAPCSVTELP